jgi:hypothetical protein
MRRVAVVGAGVIGLSVAHQSARADSMSQSSPTPILPILSPQWPRPSGSPTAVNNRKGWITCSNAHWPDLGSRQPTVMQASSNGSGPSSNALRTQTARGRGSFPTQSTQRQTSFLQAPSLESAPRSR